MKEIAAAGRRSFLVAAGVGAATAVATTFGPPRRKPLAESKRVAGTASGYRASPHVEKYYRTAEI